MSNIKSSRKAAITVEISLSILLAIGVLFLALRLFSNNLKEMADNSGIHNMFQKNTTASTFGNDPTSTSVTVAKIPTQTQIPVEIVAEQGLSDYHKEAQDTIETLAAKASPLSAQDAVNLAQALTVFAESDASTDVKPATLLTGTKTANQISYQTLASNNHISFDFSYYYQTTVNGETYDWKNANSRAKDEKLRIENVKAIEAWTVQAE